MCPNTISDIKEHERETLEGEHAPPSKRELAQLRAEQRRIETHEKRYKRALDRLTHFWVEIVGMDRQSRPPLIDPDVWGFARAIIHRPDACLAALRFIGNCYGGAVLHRVSLAAFGNGRWDETDLCARREVAFCMFVLRQARLLDWGRDRYGRLLYQPCVWGIGRGAICALLADPYSAKPLSVEALHQSRNGWMGLFVKGEDAGVFVRHRLPAEAAAVRRDEIGPSGYTCNRYWVCCNFNTKPALRSDTHGFSDDHEAGWEVVDHGPFRVPRGRYKRAFAGLLLMLAHQQEQPTAAPS